ncbi:MAG TPA: MOSC domain-containing protein, partial [Gemmatimonadaceae bacterium]
SPGGVPKLPADSAELVVEGFVGDGHDDRKHHGGPDRAVCIYAAELIDSLRAEGHPIFAGSAGENLTVSGLDWVEMVPGVRLRIGRVLIEVTSYTSPCKTIRRSFINGRFQRISQITNPGWSRVYCKVLATGLVKRGDLVGIVGQ